MTCGPQSKSVASAPPVFKCETPIPTEHIDHIPSDRSWSG